MKTIGFVKSKKEHEYRIALCLNEIKEIKNRTHLYFEKGYGDMLGFSDKDIESLGCHIVSRDEALKQDVICDPKIGDAEYLCDLKNQTIFGWVHAVQNRTITDDILKGNNTAYAWEDMFEGGRHVFYRNNELAGEVAIMQAFALHGIMPYETKVALIGRGNVANGALKILTLLGADTTIYNRKTEALLKKELPMYDVVVNAVLWDTSRKDHIIYRSDLQRMKPNGLIIDISCDRNGAIETSIPTTIDNPVYTVDGICHYVVDHTPSIIYKTSSKEISVQVVRFIDDLIEGNENPILDNALIIKDGAILDRRIIEFQNR